MDIVNAPQWLTDFIGNRFVLFIFGISLSIIIAKFAEELNIEDYTFNFQIPFIGVEISLSVFAIICWVLLISLFN